MNTNKSLIALQHEANALELAIIENNGEIPPELDEALTNVQIDLADKLDGYGFVMERFEKALKPYWKDQLEFHQKVLKAIDAIPKKLKERLKFACADELKEGEKKIVKEGNKFKFTISKLAPTVHVIDDELLPEKYLKTETVEVTNTTVDEDLLRKDLEDGVEVEGAWLEPSYRITKTKKKMKELAK